MAGPEPGTCFPAPCNSILRTCPFIFPTMSNEAMEFNLCGGEGHRAGVAPVEAAKRFEAINCASAICLALPLPAGTDLRIVSRSVRRSCCCWRPGSLSAISDLFASELFLSFRSAGRLRAHSAAA